MTTTAKQVLCRLYTDKTITLAARDGSRYISKENGVFRSFIDSCFKSWGLDKTSKATEKTEVFVYEMVKDATFTEMFDSLNLDRDKLCLSQDQIIEFCEMNADKLREDFYATFFLFKQDVQLFIARVHVGLDGLDVRVYSFKRDYLWPSSNAYRLVVPQPNS